MDNIVIETLDAPQAIGTYSQGIKSGNFVFTSGQIPLNPETGKLENGDFKFVREAVRERNLLIENAPHYVKPLPTTIPIFKWYSGLLNAPLKFLGLLDKTVERGAMLIKIGLSLYDSLSCSSY